MVAVLVHEVIGIAFVLLPHFLHNPLHIFFCEVSAAQNYGFSVEMSGGKDLDGNTTRSTHSLLQGILIGTIHTTWNQFQWKFKLDKPGH